ncbi:hypothetical protein E3N88_00481 [Mikania micrantha]|uniref:Integrase catalytic domain-containing protein n=1 Tax=Mikania micrantha TaxID=192012 RepID=A0A5N6PY91_9ASTR|nr:hypothetical protein E3N88_00481 [Mikania micrantha]
MMISTQFNRQIKTFQCDLGGEFDNHAFKMFAQQHGLLFRFSCPQTSSQNGRAERMIRRLNDIIRSLLIHSNLPPIFWVEALHTATYLHNILPTKRLNYFTLTFALYLRHPTYDHLRIFGCACYPNTSATQPNKLHTRSIRCIFLGYPADFRGYRCFDPTTGKVSISRHVTFDESTFPYTIPNSSTSYTFLDDTTPPGFHFSHPISPTQPTPNTTTTSHPIVYHRRHKPAEFTALQENATWELVPRPVNRPVIRCMWLFRHKFKADGSLERYKARLVVNGKSQIVGFDCDETFSPVVKPATIRTVLSIAVSCSWPIHQLDVKNAFLHGHLNETVYMHQPSGFVDPRSPTYVCKLKKSLYGLKQAPRAWYTRFANYIVAHGFQSSKCDNSLFIYTKNSQTAYLLLYVDDIILTASSDDILHAVIGMLSREFSMTDLGNLHHFLGIQDDHVYENQETIQLQIDCNLISD